MCLQLHLRCAEVAFWPGIDAENMILSVKVGPEMAKPPSMVDSDVVELSVRLAPSSVATYAISQQTGTECGPLMCSEALQLLPPGRLSTLVVIQPTNILLWLTEQNILRLLGPEASADQVCTAMCDLHSHLAFEPCTFQSPTASCLCRQGWPDCGVLLTGR